MRENEIDPGSLSPEAIAEWNLHVESVLRGMAHALNNRAAALSALIELTNEPAEKPPVIQSILGTELERVSEIVRVLRSIGAPRGAVEAFTPGDAAAEAMLVLQLYAEHRDAPLTVETAEAQPVRVARWMFVRALVALGAGLVRTDGAAGRRILIAAKGDWLEVDGNDSARRASLLLTELAGAMGGDVLPDRYGFRLPTLAALRRREGR